MKKEQLKALISLGLMALLLSYTASVYRAGGFSPLFGFSFGLSALVCAPLMLAFFRRMGAFACWAVTAVFGLLLGFAAGDAATAVLICAFCFGAPVAISFFWPRFKETKTLVMLALPAAGAIDFLGTLVYCRLHFGQWGFEAMIARITMKILHLFDQMEALYTQLYSGELLKQMQKYMAVFREQASALSFSVAMMVVYALFALFFISLYYADRRAAKDGLGRWSGDWAGLIPGRGISWAYMGGYLLAMMAADPYYQVLSGVFGLFGFFYVFTALYRLLQYLRRKGIPPVIRGLLIGLLAVLSYFTAGGTLLSVYTILLFAGWWIATTPVKIPPVRS